MASTSEKVNRGIRILLLQKGMQQKDLIAKTGLKPSYFGLRINNHRIWTLNDLDLIATALGVKDGAIGLVNASASVPTQEMAA